MDCSNKTESFNESGFFSQSKPRPKISNLYHLHHLAHQGQEGNLWVQICAGKNSPCLTWKRFVYFLLCLFKNLVLGSAHSTLVHFIYTAPIEEHRTAPDFIIYTLLCHNSFFQKSSLQNDWSVLSLWGPRETPGIIFHFIGMERTKMKQFDQQPYQEVKINNASIITQSQLKSESLE